MATTVRAAGQAKYPVPVSQVAAIGLRTAVVGVGGYAGGELARLLLGHPRLGGSAPLFCGRATAAASKPAVTVESLHPQLAGTELHEIIPFNWRAIEEASTEILFLATPHEESRIRVPEAVARGLRVIDLSGAWRLREAQHRAVYRFEDQDSATVEQVQTGAVYGCPELHGQAIAQARVVANPGCYATSIILALAPLLRAKLVDLDAGIVCDAKSGVSGAGKAPTSKTHFMHAADNLSAYAVFDHRHTGELLEQLDLTREQIRFTPHLLPIPRGILSSIYLRLNCRMSPIELYTVIEGFYRGRPLVRVRRPGDLPQIHHVVHSPFCDIGFALDQDGQRLFLVSCLDNLLKGAASQAVQNMNLMCGWGEAEGLR